MRVLLVSHDYLPNHPAGTEIYTAQIGGMDPSLLVGQRVKIITKQGEIFGVIGRKAIHMMTPEERKKAVSRSIKEATQI